jgi:drug/metabolite transporter (DMT)-like permease
MPNDRRQAMKSIWPRLLWALVAGASGLVLILVGMEKSTLIHADADLKGITVEPPGSVFVLLSIGVLLLSPAVFGALTVLGRHRRERRRERPGAREVPVLVLLAIAVVAGGLGLWTYVAHTTHIRSLAEVSLDVDSGFIALQGLCGTIVIAALVVMGVRWTPGHQPARARR